ncbi:50S ribosomal protein L19, partial [Patescibacteria group bacterium]
MNQKVIEFNLSQRNKEIPELKGGDVVKVHRKIKEGDKERIQVFEGMIVAMRGGQSSSPTITVRKVSQGVGVELVLPVFSPTIEKIELVKRAKVRRSKLYYIREKTLKSLRFKYTYFADLVAGKKDDKKEEVKEEANEEVKEEKKVVKKEESTQETPPQIDSTNTVDD